MPVAMAGKESATITAEADVVLAAAAYLGFATKVICPGPASSIPATPVISVSGLAFSSVDSSADAISESFMVATGFLGDARRASRKHRYLERIFRAASATTGLLFADHGQNSDVSQGGSRHKDSLGITTGVGRKNRKAVASLVQKIVGHHAFDDLVVTEAQAHPQAF